MSVALNPGIDEAVAAFAGLGLASLLAVRDRLEARVAAVTGDFDAESTWALDGATSMTAWLRQRGLGSGAAGSLARTGRRMHKLPVTAAAWLDGSLSIGQAQAVVANVDDRHVSLFAEHEAAVVPTLIPLSVRDTGQAMQQWRLYAEALDDDVDRGVPENRLHLSTTLGGRGELSGSFSAESTAVLQAAIDAALRPDAEGEERVAAERRADALVDMCRYFLDHQDTVPKRRNRPHVNVVIDYGALLGGQGQLLSGPALDVATMRRLLCDAGVHRVLTDGDSSILDYGRATRSIPDAVWNALVLRDRHCRHPGCDRQPGWCEGHHVVPWEHGGATNLANLVLKCSRHHHLGHRPGWSEKLKPDATLEITMPDGRVLMSHPPGVLRL